MNDNVVAIIGSVISGIVAIITFVLSNVIPRIGVQNSIKTKTEIYEKQLSNIFEPLAMLLDEQDKNISDKLVADIKEIIYRNFLLVPGKLLEAYHDLSDTSKDKEKSEFVFRDVVYSNYNWIKKNLSYPYDIYRITVSCLDKEERDQFKNKILKKSLLIIMAIAALSFLTALMLYFWGETVTSAIIEIVIILGLGFSIVYLLNHLSPSVILRIKGKIVQKIPKNSRSKRGGNRRIAEIPQTVTQTITGESHRKKFQGNKCSKV